jgi:hypothetical protein
MAQPSRYESEAWADIQRFRGRPVTRGLHSIGDSVATGAGAIQRKAAEFADEHTEVRKAQATAARALEAARDGIRVVGDAVPDEVKAQVGEWGRAAASSTTRTVARVSRAGLSPRRVVRKHQSAGHDVRSLSDLRSLDLEQIDQIRGRGLGWYYPAAAALSGAGAGLVITGGELAIAVTGGAAAAPGAGTVTAAVVLDSTAVLGLASRAVGHVSLYYGYDPEVPAEKLFVLSVVNAGTALSASAKAKAMAEISRLTQQLFRGAAWRVLDQALITQVAKQLASRFGVRFTKQSLGKVVPAAGIVLGASFNWATLESIVDAADVAYRRRFLLDKYPGLADDAMSAPFEAIVPEEQDEVISVLDEVVEAGGPDLRLPEEDRDTSRGGEPPRPESSPGADDGEAAGQR